MVGSEVRDRSGHIFRGRVLFGENGDLAQSEPEGFWRGLEPHRDRLIHTIRHAAAESEHIAATLYHWLDERLWTQNVHLVGRQGEVDVHFRAPLPSMGPARDEALVERVMAHAADVLLMTEATPLSVPGPRVVYANPAFTRMTGYAVEEILGLTPRILQGDGTEPEALDYMRTRLRAFEDFQVEVTNYRKDGRPFVVHLDVRAVRDGTGWVTHWVSTQRDVTPQRLSRAGLGLSAEAPERRTDLRTLGHGLNDAHTTILGNVEVAKEAAPPSLRPLLDDVESAVVQAHHLTRRLFRLLGDQSVSETESTLSILWVDDDPLVRTVAKRIGDARRWEVCTASDASEALERAAERSFDLIILDHSNGEEICGSQLQAQLRHMGVSSPILLAVSDRIGEESRGPDTIGKPFRLVELDAQVQRLLLRR
ncbi:MAG: PAS domain-containing protein [Myxococcota bacterium]